MVINNFNEMKDFLDKCMPEESFLSVEIIRRGKDHKNLPSANKMFKAFYVSSFDSLKSIEDEVIALCELYKARAYINVSRRSFEAVCKQNMHMLSKRILDGDYKCPQRIFNRAVDNTTPLENLWIVDLDKEILECTSIEELMNFQFKEKNNASFTYTLNDKVVKTINTLSGKHLITRGFNSARFNEVFPEISVHKHGLTLLYGDTSLYDIEDN